MENGKMFYYALVNYLEDTFRIKNASLISRFFKNDMIDEICIWGMGQRGLSLFYHLKRNGYDIMCFGDNDKTKHGNYGGKYCVPLEYLRKDKDRLLIIISNANEKEKIKEQLEKEGFHYLIFDTQLEQIDIVNVKLPDGNENFEQAISEYNEVVYEMLSSVR